MYVLLGEKARDRKERFSGSTLESIDRHRYASEILTVFRANEVT